MNSPWPRRRKWIKSKAARPHTVRPHLERLEDRTTPTTVLVNTAADAHALNAAASPSIDKSGDVSLRSALEYLNANPGTNDTVNVPNGHYFLTLGALPISDANGVAVVGVDGAAVTLLDAQMNSRVMEITGGTTNVVLQGLTVENGSAPPGSDPGGSIGSTDAAGGGILDEGNDLTILESVVQNNVAQGAAGGRATPTGFALGGAIFENASGTLTLTYSTVENNLALAGDAPSGFGSGGVAAGGGVYTLLGDLVVRSSTVSGNRAQGGAGRGGGSGGFAGGGGLDFDRSGNLTISDSTISGDTAVGGDSVSGGNGGFGGEADGGGVYNSGTATVTNSTIADNQADGGAGDSGAGAAFGGGYYENVGDPTSIGSTIVAANTVGGGKGTQGTDVYTNDAAAHPFTSLGFNLIGDNDQAGGGNGFTDGVRHDQVGGTDGGTGATIDPMLGPLQDNGGPTETMALLAGSPAIDQGSDSGGLAFDQRGTGFARTVDQPNAANADDGTDVGAFEVQAAASPPAPPTPTQPPATPVDAPPVLPTFVSKVQLLGSDTPAVQGADIQFVNGLYQNLLGRAPTQGEVNTQMFLLESGVPRLQIADGVWQSPEHRALEVQQDYQTFLQRPADPSEVAAWVSVFAAGAGEAGVAQDLLLSPEYQNAHASDAAYVSGLYNDVLGRAPDTAGEASWLQQLQNGTSRAAVAQAFLTSPEADTDLVTPFYTTYLHRTPSAAQAQAWVGALESDQLSPMQVGELILTGQDSPPSRPGAQSG